MGPQTHCYNALRSGARIQALRRLFKGPHMSDIAVYGVVNLQVTDAVAYRQYEKGFFPILKRYGGEFITFDDAPVHLEGTAPRAGRMIIFKFPSEEKAQAWFADPEYQALSEHRRAGTALEFLTLVRGLPPRT
jgi:uncharacterized protein (DUF1330 family)